MNAHQSPPAADPDDVDVDSLPEDEPLSPQSLPRRARNGKVARLPGELRELVNQMMFDGDFYRHIIGRVTKLGYPGIRPQNLSEWRKGGFQDWLHSRRDVEDLKLDRQALLDAAKNCESETNVAKANEVLLSLRGLWPHSCTHERWEGLRGGVR